TTATGLGARLVNHRRSCLVSGNPCVELRNPVMRRPSGPSVVVLGMMGRSPFAGVGWQVLHYLEGFRRLGCAVTYIEDTGEWPYDPEQNTITDDCRYTTGYIGRLMEWCGLPDRWAYIAAAQGGRAMGPVGAQVGELLARADVLVNLTGATVLRDEHLRVPVRLYVETDPVQPQIDVARGDRAKIALLEAHTHHFSYGENLGAADCLVPVEQFRYRPTGQPVVLDWWPTTPAWRPDDRSAFTTIATWRQSDRDLEWKGTLYTWSKHQQFLQYVDLPGRVQPPLELALARADAD